jgi:hypothetical protein
MQVVLTQEIVWEYEVEGYTMTTLKVVVHIYYVNDIFGRGTSPPDDHQGDFFEQLSNPKNLSLSGLITIYKQQCEIL